MTTLDKLINEYDTKKFRLKSFVQLNVPGPYGKSINLLDFILEHKIGDYLRLNSHLLREYYLNVTKLFYEDKIDAKMHTKLLDIDKLTFKEAYTTLKCDIDICRGKIFSDKIKIKYPRDYENVCTLITKVLISAVEFYSNKVVNEYLKYSIRSVVCTLTFSEVFHNINNTASEYKFPEPYIGLLDLMLFSLSAPAYFAFVGDLIESVFQSLKEKSLKLNFHSLSEYLNITKKLAPFYLLYDLTIGSVTNLLTGYLSYIVKPKVVERVFSRYLNYFIFFSTVNQLYGKYESLKEKLMSFIKR